MTLFTFDAEDVVRGTLLKTGWYPLEVTKVEEGIAKSSGNPKVTVSFRCLEGEREPDGEKVTGVPLFTTFSPSAPGFAMAFFKALGAGDIKAGTSLNLSDETCKGKKVEGYVIQDQYEGKTNNKIADYRPISS